AASITRLPVTRSLDSAYGPSVTTRSRPRIVLPPSSSGYPPMWRPALASASAHAYHFFKCACIAVGERPGISGAPPRKTYMNFGMFNLLRVRVRFRRPPFVLDTGYAITRRHRDEKAD